jgi:hypothetical protein
MPYESEPLLIGTVLISFYLIEIRAKCLMVFGVGHWELGTGTRNLGYWRDSEFSGYKCFLASYSPYEVHTVDI